MARDVTKPFTWPYPCWACGSRSVVAQHLIDRARNRTTVLFFCECGIEGSLSRPYLANYDGLERALVTPGAPAPAGSVTNQVEDSDAVRYTRGDAMGLLRVLRELLGEIVDNF